MPEQDLLARAGRMLETATSIRQSDPTAAVSLAASVVVQAQVAVLNAHGQQPTPADEQHLGKAVTELGEPLAPADRLTALLEARDGASGTVDVDEALTDARTAVDRAHAAIRARPRG